VSLTVHIDGNRNARTSFDKVRDRANAAGRRLSQEDLNSLAYDSLPLAATMHAGPSRMPLEDVAAAMKDRRSRFLPLSPQQLLDVQLYLKLEGAWNATLLARAEQDAPAFEDLEPGVQLWMTLKCLHTHVDFPAERINACYSLAQILMASGMIHSSYLDEMGHTLSGLLAPGSEEEIDGFRSTIERISNQITSLLPADSRELCTSLYVRHYHCTAGCFHDAA
jgi:hypothetical protein